MGVLFCLKNSDLSKSDLCNTVVEVSHQQRRFLRTSEKVLLMFIRLKKDIKQSPKSLHFTNPESDKFNSRAAPGMFYSPGAADQQRSLQEQGM